MNPTPAYRALRASWWTFVLMIGFAAQLHSQAITNAGRDFWFAFPEPVDGQLTVWTPQDTSIVFQVNVSSRFSTSGFVEIPNSGFLVPFNVTPGSVSKVIIPDSLAWINTSDSVEMKAIHVHVEDDCVVYGNTYHQFRSEASLILPNRALGSLYYAMTSYPVERNFTTGFAPWASELVVIAPGEQVTVEITPSTTTLGGNLAGVPFTVTLDSGELIQLQGNALNDLTGTKVECIDPEKTVAVVAGNVWSMVECNTTADPLLEAMFPASAWGREYILVPTPDVGLDMYRVLAMEDDTEIYKDGVLLTTIDEGEFYQDTHQVARLISSNNPIAVGQFMVSNSTVCSNIFQGDPSMVMINPNEQMFLDSITFFAVSEVQININHVVIVTRTNDTATLELDGSPVPGFSMLDADPTYAYTSVIIDTGSHNLFSSGCGFVAYSIGLGTAESYSYAAGVRLTDLSGGVSFENITINSDTICQFDSLQFEIQAQGNPNSYAWDLGDGTTSTLINPIHAYDSGGTYFVSVILISDCRTDTVLDTITVVPLPFFELGVDTTICLQDSFVISTDSTALSYLWSGGATGPSFTADTSGTYFVTASNTRCSWSDSIRVDFNPTVNSFDVDQIQGDSAICNDDSIQFEGFTSGQVLYWLWELGDGNTDTAQSFIYSYGIGGGYTVELQAAYLCASDTIIDTFLTSVQVIQRPEIDLRTDTAVCVPPLLLQAGASENPDYTYQWTPLQSDEFEVEVTEAGTYTLLVANADCSIEDSIRVQFEEELLFPNVITPNADGVNDLFRIQGSRFCHDFDELLIYNRWGQLIYHTRAPLRHGWDGYSPAGEPATKGVYFYILRGPDGVFEGTITLF